MLKCWVFHSLSIPPLSDNYISLAFRVGYYFKPYTKSRIVQPQEEAELHVLKGDFFFFFPSFLFPPSFSWPGSVPNCSAKPVLIVENDREAAQVKNDWGIL